MITALIICYLIPLVILLIGYLYARTRYTDNTPNWILFFAIIPFANWGMVLLVVAYYLEEILTQE